MNNKDRGLATQSRYKVYVLIPEHVYNFEVYATDEQDARHEAYAALCLIDPNREWNIIGIELINGACNE